MPIDERFLKKRHTTEGCLGLNNALAEKQANVWSGLTLDQRDFHQVHTVQQANFQRRAFDKEHDYYVEKKRTIDHADPTASWCTKASVGFNFGAPSRREMSGEWRGASAAGCTLHEGAERNPQFHLRVDEETACHLVLTQRDVRGTATPLRHIHLLVAYTAGDRVRRMMPSERACSSGKYINLRQVVTEGTLRPRAQPYTVFVSTFDPGEETSFVISVHSDLPVSLTPIAYPGEEEQV